MLQQKLKCVLRFSLSVNQLSSCRSGLIDFFFCPMAEMAFPGICVIVSKDGAKVSYCPRGPQTVRGPQCCHSDSYYFVVI